MDETGSATGYLADLANVPEGTRVVGADGAKLGEVVGVYRDRLIVERGFFFPTDYYVPFDAVDVYEAGTIRLGLSLNGALRQGWDAVPADEPAPVLPSAPAAPAAARPAARPAAAAPPVALAGRGPIVEPETTTPRAPQPTEMAPKPAAPPAAPESAPPAPPPMPAAVLPPSEGAAAASPGPPAPVPRPERPGARTSTLGRLFPDLVAGAEPEQSATAPAATTPGAEASPATTADASEPSSETQAVASADPAASSAPIDPAEPIAGEDHGNPVSTAGEAIATSDDDGNDRSADTGGTTRMPTV